MRFHLGGSGAFSFFDSPAGKELVTIDADGFVGIGTNFPTAMLEVRGDILLGPNGQYLATSGQEDLRIIRGVISSTGTILAGQGFTVARTAVGSYTVNFTVPFSDIPAITTSAQSGLSIVATSTSVAAGSSQFRTFASGSAALTDNQFHFIAIGPR